MKSLYRTTVLFCLIALLVCSTASAETENKDLPTKEELLSFTENVTFDSCFPTEALVVMKEKYPTYKCDIWNVNGEVQGSFYYSDTDSEKGYGSIYYDKSGKTVPRVCGITYELKESYKGEVAKESVTKNIEEVDTDDTNKKVSENKEVIEDEEKEDSVSDEKNEKVSTEKTRIIKKIANLLTNYNNDKIDIDELRDRINEILEEE